MKLVDFLKEKFLNEDVQVFKLATGFKKVVPAGTNYVDSHAPLQPFGTKWGRGVIVNNGGTLETIIGTYGTSHANLKKGMNPGEQTNGTFYWGYDTANKTLYFEYGSDRTFDFNNSKVLQAIISGLQNSNTVMKRCRIVQKGVKND